ncbi:LADA_0G09428g1_1 [Lachancea dasiensis]|uniref:LADA_0G09428g1_1 n=1 Tax=Lachancea dasiensis TaxID=1072105 RepID=A0A1G4JUE5_9SACH|nr:LADA_0G09428g1_1 [Lachancea dasiensis]
MHSEANSSPQQRIITSEQWVFDRKGSRDDSKNQGENRPKRASLSKQERESRRKQRELENEQLQREFQTVQSENSRLKSVVARLKQDIDSYTRLIVAASKSQNGSGIACRAGLGSATLAEAPSGASNDDLPPMETLLVNTPKRRKRGQKLDPSNFAMGRDIETDSWIHDDGPGVLRNTEADVMLAPRAPDLGPDDVALMSKLKDVLAEME